MLPGKIMRFQQREFFDGSNMDFGPVNNPIDAKLIFIELLLSTDKLKDIPLLHLSSYVQPHCAIKYMFPWNNQCRGNGRR